VLVVPALVLVVPALVLVVPALVLVVPALVLVVPAGRRGPLRWRRCVDTVAGMTAVDQPGYPEPPAVGSETATLLGSLERLRATFAGKCAGLGAAGALADGGPEPYLYADPAADAAARG
jgi:hypothetical protein